jgi:hypothetical protein
MFVAPRAENLPSLDYLGRQTVTMHCIVITRARFYKFWTNSEQLQVSHLLDSVCTEYFQKLGQGGLRQSFDIVIAGKHWPISLAKGTFELQAFSCNFRVLSPLRGSCDSSSEKLASLSVLHLHEVLAFLFCHMDAIIVVFGLWLLHFLVVGIVLMWRLLFYIILVLKSWGDL